MNIVTRRMKKEGLKISIEYRRMPILINAQIRIAVIAAAISH